MTITAEALAKLAKPLDPKRVKKREGGGGRSLSYLEGHDVIRAANEIFGIGGWSYRLGKLICLGTEDVVGRDNRKGVRVAYTAEVFVRAGDAEYGDVGYGDAIEYGGSILTPHELASKEAVTDGLKRALKNLGDQFGLCLYDKFAPEHDGGSRSGASHGASGAGEGTRANGAAGTSSPAAPDFTLPFGKHKGKTIAEVDVEDPGWLDWFLENGKKEDIKAAIQAHRDGSAEAGFAAVGATLLDDPDDLPF